MEGFRIGDDRLFGFLAERHERFVVGILLAVEAFIGLRLHVRAILRVAHEIAQGR